MLKSFFSCPNVLLRLLVVLVFAGGLVFAGTFDGFVPKIQAESCCCSETDATPTDQPVEQLETSGCCGGGTDALLAEAAAAQPEINENPEEPIPAQGNACSYEECDTSVCFGSGCTSGCGPVAKCTGTCKCRGSRCKSSKPKVCSSSGTCNGCDGTYTST